MAQQARKPRSDVPRQVPQKGLLMLALPIAVSFWARDLLSGGVDLAFASQLEGEEGIGDASLAAIRLALPFNWLMIAFWVGASNGLTSRLGSAMAAHQGERIEQLKRATLRIIVAFVGIFLALAAAIWLLTDRFVADPLTARQFRIYGAVLVAGTGLTSFWSVVPDSLVKAHRDTVTTMVAGLISGGLNAVLNWFFVFVAGWGIFGIAFSTVLSRIPPLLYSLWRARAHEARRIATGHDCEPGLYAAPVREILALAIPSGAAFIIMAGEGQLLNMLLGTGENATSTLAAWLLFDYLGRFFAMPCIALSVAALPLVAHAWGKRDLAEIRREIAIGLRATVLYCLLFVAPVVAVFADPVVDYFSDSPETGAALGAAIYLVPLASLVQAPMFLAKSTFEGMQSARPGLLMTLVRMVLATVLTYAGYRLGLDAPWNPLLGASVGFCLGVGLCSGALGAWLARDLHSRERALEGAG